MSTINEVAHKAGVSKATVSRVLSGSSQVKDETRNRVLAAIEQLDFNPSPVARSLATNKSYTVGLVATDIGGPYYGPASSAIEATLRKHERHVIIASGQSTLEGEREAVDFLIKRQVDALVLITHFLPEEEVVEINQRCPVFVMHQHFSDDEHCVDFDNYTGGRMAVEYLISQGHRKIAVVSGPRWKRDAYQRYMGAVSAIETAGQTLHWQSEGHFLIQDGKDCMKEILALPEQPSAVFFANDMMAIGALRVCADENVQVPKDIAIMGFDDWAFSKDLVPRLTTVHMPLYKMAEATALLVLNDVYGTHHAVNRLFEPTLVIRESA